METRDEQQNVTVRLDRATIRRAKALAARQGTSVSRLLCDTIRRLVDEDEAYGAAEAKARAALEKGLRLGGRVRASRDELHER